MVVRGLGPAVEIDTNHGLTCARSADGHVSCVGEWWGATPSRVQGLSDAVELAVGQAHGCARRRGGTVACWGESNAPWGVLGDGSSSERKTRAAVAVRGLDDVVAIDAGGASTCARRRDGSTWCWGNNGTGLLADGTRTHRAAPVRSRIARDARAFVVGSESSCAITRAGAVECWGGSELGPIALRANDPAATAGTRIGGMDGAVAIAVGHYHVCALRPSGEVVCAGSNRYGELGRGSMRGASAVPMDVPGIVDAEQVVAGEWDACIRRRGGAVACVSRQAFRASAVAGVTGAASIANGGQYTCARARSGRTVCWGNATFRPCFWESEDNCQSERWARARPTAGLGDIAGAIAIDKAQCAIVAGSVRCLSVDVSRGVRQETMRGLSDVVQIAGGYGARCARRRDGSVWCWAWTADGGPRDPTAVSGVAGARDLAVGRDHACAALDSGVVVCWGSNARGQLGDGSMRTRIQPAPVAGLADVVQIGAGDAFTCARRRDGHVLCWGSNAHGELGTGTSADRLQPALVAGVADAVELAVGFDHACARRRSGRVACWGELPQGPELARSPLGPVVLPAR